jgi:hypothetical protein
MLTLHSVQLDKTTSIQLYRIVAVHKPPSPPTETTISAANASKRPLEQPTNAIDSRKRIAVTPRRLFNRLKSTPETPEIKQQRLEHERLFNQLRQLNVLSKSIDSGQSDKLDALTAKWRQAALDTADALMTHVQSRSLGDGEAITKRQMLMAIGVDPVYLGVDPTDDDF